MIQVGHVETGFRQYDIAMTEDTNQDSDRLVSRISYHDDRMGFRQSGEDGRFR